MIIVYKNFFRNRMVNLSKKSVKHFIPDAKIYCISLYKNDEHDYEGQEPLDSDIIPIYKKTKWITNNNKPMDDVIDSKTSGYAYPDNAQLFAEGLNLVFDAFKEIDEKVLMLAEDHFFTTGGTLKELVDNDYDWAYGTWDTNTDVNGSVICFNPKQLSHILPIPDGSGAVEGYLEREVTLKVDPTRRYRIRHRHNVNYFGDGIYTNSSEVMIAHLRQAGII